MRFTYTVYKDDGTNGHPIRTDIFTREEELKPEHYTYPFYVQVFDNLKKLDYYVIRSQDDLEGFVEAQARAYTWSDKQDKAKWNPLNSEETDIQIKGTNKPIDHINPSHYQGYIETELEVLQWLEAMQYLPHYRDPRCFIAAVELQVRKYLDRSGGKDEELQETKKALWYLRFMTAYMANGYKPIRVKDIDKLLGNI